VQEQKWEKKVEIIVGAVEQATVRVLKGIAEGAGCTCADAG